MKALITKSIALVTILITCSLMVAGYGTVHAQPCNTTDCFIQKLDLNQVETDDILIKRGPQTYINVAYAFWIVIIVVLVIARVAFAGFGLAQSKEDAEKRKENFRKIANAVLGLVVGVGAPGITFIALSILGLEPPDQEYLDCTQLTGELRTECLRITN
jgi:hypothetical protein